MGIVQKIINGDLEIEGGNLKVTGETNVGVISASTIISGSTNLYDIFLTSADGNDITRLQNGLNTYTGGTENNPTINISSATLHDLSVSGETNVGVLSATTIYLNEGILIGNNTADADSNNVGTLRYRVSANTSYFEVCMQTGATSYYWIVVKENSW